MSTYSTLHEIFMCLILIIPFGDSLSFNFTSFTSSNDNITYERASLVSDHIQLTSTNGTVGRATYKHPIHIWDHPSRKLANFSTYFVFQIDSQNRPTYGDGLAFFLATRGTSIPTVAKEGSFGLNTDNDQNNLFVAVEFDVFRNTWDPAGEHVGIDINNVVSVTNSTWSSGIRDGRRTDVWINYDAGTHNLSVDFTGVRDNVTVKQHIDYKVDLSVHLPEFVTIGFSAAAGNESTLHSIYSWEFSLEEESGGWTSEGPPPPPPRTRRRRRGNSKKVKLGVGLGAGIGGGVGVAVCVFVFLWFRERRKEGSESEDESSNALDNNAVKSSV